MTAPRDPGLQPERTALAWSRTALAVLANGVLVLLRDAHRITPVTLVPVLVAVLLAAALVWYGRRRQRQLATGPPAPAEPRAIYLLGSSVLLLVVATALTW